MVVYMGWLSLCISLILLVASLTFIGWIGGVSMLASVRARYIPMAPSTALCFSLLGIGLLLQLKKPSLSWIERALAGVVLIVGAAKLVEFLSGRSFGIDAWFVRNPEMFGGVPTGRMAPLTALIFIFSAAGLFALTTLRFSRRAASARRAHDHSGRCRSGWLLVWHAFALRRHHHSRRALDGVGIFSFWHRNCCSRRS